MQLYTILGVFLSKMAEANIILSSDMVGVEMHTYCNYLYCKTGTLNPLLHVQVVPRRLYFVRLFNLSRLQYLGLAKCRCQSYSYF